MKMRNKGKVYPSPSSTSSSLPSSYSPPDRDALSVLKLLPTAIFALVSLLSFEDRGVLAYMITRSMKSTSPSSFIEEKNKNSKKSNAHKPPLFDCDCFDCYTSYWFRWDSSPNRELIHQAIEAFEEHLNNGEQSKKNNRGKKRDKMGHRLGEKPVDVTEVPVPERDVDGPETNDDDTAVQVLPENNLPPAMSLPENPEETSGNGEDKVDEAQEHPPEEVVPPVTAVVVRSSAASNHKGLARKVLPDVIGLLNSRLWSLWSPNM